MIAPIHPNKAYSANHNSPKTIKKIVTIQNFSIIVCLLVYYTYAIFLITK